MSTLTTLGVKVEPELKTRLQDAAMRLSCSPHALHKRALADFLGRLERGEVSDIGLSGQAADSTGVGAAGSAGGAGHGGAGVFSELYREVHPQSHLRAAITSAYRRPEPECVPLLLSLAQSEHPDRVQATAMRLVNAVRAKHRTSPVEALIQAFSLSTQEGVALMCLAEALLRVPDQATRDALIRDKIAKGDWRAHVSDSSSIFVSAATWGLLLTGKLVSLNSERTLSAALTRLIGKGGEPLVRKGVDLAMRMLGEQFVSGQTIGQALSHAAKLQKQGFRYSFDMLGEAAMTAADAQRYFEQYQQAIHAIGKASRGQGIYDGNGISIKLSALHPRYSRAKHVRVMSELYPRLLDLVQLARQYDIGINIDAEEADRLDVSLDVLERLCFEQSLAGWDGIGTVIQAYQKRALFVVDYVVDLARRSNRRMMVRLVKGAYWDTEIKRAQVDGLDGYPVFTRKVHTDVSYLACAARLLDAPQFVFAQFATHNAQTVAAIFHMAGGNYYQGQYEFQCLHGMGEPMYEEVVKAAAAGGLNRPCRIYAPVGTHETLLPYLVRRLLENGANSSFVNLIHDEGVNVTRLVADPVDEARAIEPLGSPHPKIPAPLDLYKAAEGSGGLALHRLASRGIDLSNESRLASLAVALLSSAQERWRAGPMLASAEGSLGSHGSHGSHGSDGQARPARTVVNPADQRDVVGHVVDASREDLAMAVAAALACRDVWHATPVDERAAVLLRAADLFEANEHRLIGLIVREAGKTLPSAIGEVREAVDFLRYYAGQAQLLQSSMPAAQPPGVVACISPWNFPLAIFTGQVAAALAVGNVVLAKPAEQTSLIACEAVRLMHEAGVLRGALQCLPGLGQEVGQPLVANSAVDAVIFTGSTGTARLIHREVSQRLNRHGQPVTLIAETGGLNAMVVDSSALPEQVVSDVIASAFDSAGQRCSALRVLLVQDDTAEVVLAMLKGAMDELSVGNPARLSTDIGPVIDTDAMRVITDYIAQQKALKRPVYQSPAPGAKLQADLQTHVQTQAQSLGNFVVPTMIEIDSLDAVSQEIFGPVLHVMRYRREDLDRVFAQLNAKGFGLTFGVHTRIDEMSLRSVTAMQVGNVYVNRNIIGASVGVQPFGGQGLSGTGPKAGGPLYLASLVHTDGYTLPAWVSPGKTTNTSQPHTNRINANGPDAWPAEFELPGPTGESNVYQLLPRGEVLCLPQTAEGLAAMCQALARTGNRPQVLEQTAKELGQVMTQVTTQLKSAGGLSIKVVPGDLVQVLAAETQIQAVLFEGDADQLLAVQQILANRSGALVPVLGLRTEQIEAGQCWPLHRLLHEKSVCINTAAAGGNASLMTLG